MNDPKTIEFLWKYVAHADGQVLAAADTLDDRGYFLDQGISFGSVHNMLVHCLSAQASWLQRLNQVGNPPMLDPATVSRGEIAGRWGALHQELLAFAAAQTPASLNTVIHSGAVEETKELSTMRRRCGLICLAAGPCSLPSGWSV
ncbi:MAG TPA: DinB family protein [Tepidisphaeraceae bacterium]|nr:DinB family protein [Tepidisphaeraceae bacterium]